MERQRRLIITGVFLCVFGATFVMSQLLPIPKASAQAAQLPSNSWELRFDSMYAQSGTDTKVIYIPLDQFPKDLSFANWPMRSDRCSSSTLPSVNGRKTLPSLPRLRPVPDITDDIPSTSSNWYDEWTPSDTLVLNAYLYENGDKTAYNHEFNKRGNYRAWAGDCQPTSIPWASMLPNSVRFKYSAYRDGGTSVLSPWSVRGYSVAPYAYGGWATTTDDSKLTRTLTNAKLPTTGYACAGGSFGTIWIDRILNGIDDASGTYDGIFEGTGHTIKPIWGQACASETDYLSDLYGDNGYSYSQIETIRNTRLANDNDNTNQEIYSNGMTLFRTKFTLSEEDMKEIKAAEALGGGIYLDFVADDFYVVHINGVLGGARSISAVYDTVTVNSDRFNLKVGENLIAFQVYDKLHAFDPDGGAGLGFGLSLKKPAGYNLVPSTLCNGASGLIEVTPGAVVSCVHTVDKRDGVDPIQTGTKGTVACTDAPAAVANCAKTYTVNDSALVFSGHNFTIPSTWKDGDKVCLTFSVAPATKPRWGSGNAYGTNTGNKVCLIVKTAVTTLTYPLAHFYRGDVFSYGKLQFSDYDPATARGSRVQYAALANGAVNKFVTAANYAAPERLVFSNHLTAGAYGFMGLPPLHATGGVQTTGLTPSCPGGANYNINPSVTNGSVVYCDSSRTLKQAKDYPMRATIVVKGDVTIDENIVAGTNPAANLLDVPHLTIMATGNITIAASATRVDATLIANGELRTCEVQPTDAAQCNQQLTINGPTRAKVYKLYRTYVNASNPAEPAEIFRFTPVAIVSPYRAATSDATMVVDNEVELPPRY
ncbi:MAG: hypothetical protein ACM3MA_02655 [Acidobacteriota bacterium]